MSELLLALALWTSDPAPIAAAAAADPEPALTDLGRFPCTETVRVNYEFAREHVEWVRSQRSLSPWEPTWWTWLEEAERCRECWLQLHLAQPAESGGEDDGTYDRVGSLRELRDLIGREAYWAGRMPPPAPWQRFRRVP